MKLKEALHKIKIPLELKRILGNERDRLQTKAKIFKHLAIFLKSVGLVGLHGI